jgi:hypothetical protein
MLKDLYDKYEVPPADRIPLEKNILLLVPDSKYDLSVALDGMGLSRFEVAVTWPKASIDTFAEIQGLKPKLVVQCGQNITRKFRSATTIAEFQTLRPLALAATADSFVGLHHHDEFSIRDGLGTVKNLVSLLKKQRRSFCCVSNHGTVGGWVRQYKACRDAGIKAVFACLLPDQPIITMKGVKRIQDVVVGDEVLTHRGRFKKVLTTSVRDYDGKIYSPEFWGNGDCWVTEEHPFLCYIGGTKKIREKGSRSNSYDWDYKFVWEKVSTQGQEPMPSIVPGPFL